MKQLLAAMLLLALPAFSATFTVTKTADTADGACDADCSLREAIIAANNASGADSIMLPAGTYELTLSGAAELAGLSGDLNIHDDLTISGAGVANTFIDGGYDRVNASAVATDRVMTIHGVTVTLNDLTVQHGYPYLNNGGGLWNAGGDLTLNNVTVTGNVGHHGAGIVNGTYNITDSNAPNGPTYGFIDISATGTNLADTGGALANDGSFSSGGTDAIDLGFDFTYFGATYNKIYLISEGYLAFRDDNLTNSGIQPLPDSDYIMLGLLPFKAIIDADANVGSGGGVFYQTIGSAPNRQFIATYDVEVADWIDINSSTAQDVVFQVILAEADNSITFQYEDVETVPETRGGAAVIGITGPQDNLEGVQYSFGQAALSNGLALRFAPGVGQLAVNNSTISANFFDQAEYNDRLNEFQNFNTELYDASGLGIYNTGTLTVSNSTISNNNADFVDIDNTTGEFGVPNPDPGNADYGHNGVGIGNSGGTVTITDSVIAGNRSGGHNGGGLINRYGTMTLNNTEVSGNYLANYDGPSGGGIANFKGDLVIENSQIINNTIIGEGAGGGIFSMNGTVTISGSNISGNKAGDAADNIARGSSGGGIKVIRTTLNISDSTIDGNATNDSDATGGGIDATKSIVNLANVTVSNNVNNTTDTTSSDSVGGGIRSFQSDLTLRNNSMITGNTITTASGGGVAHVDFYGYIDISSKQSGGPIYDFIDISSTGAPLTLADKTTSASQSIGFTFQVFGQDETSVTINDDGDITFATSSYTLEAYGSGNLDPGAGGQIYVATQGTAPNRQFIVQYHQVPLFDRSETVTFQIILSETSNDMLMQYADVEQSEDTASNYPNTVEISGSDFQSLQPSDIPLTNGLALLFQPIGTLDVSYSNISNNIAADQGGGIYVDSPKGGSSRVSVIDNNTAPTDPNIRDVQGTFLADNVITNPSSKTLTGTDNVVESLISNIGRDTLTGGTGTDYFVYPSRQSGGDIITDFVPSEDKLDITGLLNSIGYSGSDPVADGHFSFAERRGFTMVIFNAQDGSRPSVLTLLRGTTIAEIQAAGSESDLFVFDTP